MSLRLIRTAGGIAGCMALAACTSLPLPLTPSREAPVSAKSLMETVSSWNGHGLSYPQGNAKITALEITVAPGAETGWHHPPVPSLAYILEGSLEIRLRDGTSKRFKAGQAVAEVVNTEHNGRNPGDRPTRLIVFYVGTTDRPLTINSPQ